MVGFLIKALKLRDENLSFVQVELFRIIWSLIDANGEGKWNSKSRKSWRPEVTNLSFVWQVQINYLFAWFLIRIKKDSWNIMFSSATSILKFVYILGTQNSFKSKDSKARKRFTKKSEYSREKKPFRLLNESIDVKRI